MLVVSIGAIGIGLVAVVALVLLSGGLGGSSVAAVSPSDIPAPAEELRQGRTLVQPGSTPPVTIEVYEDPQCGHCATFTKRIEPLLISEFVADGTASLTYKDFVVFGGESWDAAAAMRVAEALDGKFWELHGVIFQNQSGVNDGAYSRARLADMAALVGLDRDEFLREMDDPSYRDAVEAEVLEGNELTISSTPTLVINGELIRGTPPWEDLAAIIEEAAGTAVPEA
jgi:protein-disulfide isomerase